MVEASSRPASLHLMERLGLELAAGSALVATAVPTCLAAGVLAFAPLGPDYIAIGVAAGLCCAVFAAPVAAYLSGTPWLAPTPRSSTAVIQASLLANLWRGSGTHDLGLVLGALALCVFMAGLFQILFGLGGVARLVKFTPHPVLAGFLNGVALLLLLPQLGRYVQPSGFVHPAALVLLLLLAAVTLFGRRLPTSGAGAVLGLVVGICAYYGAGALAPGLDLGPLTGAPGATFMPTLSLLALPRNEAVMGRLLPMAPDILLTSLSLAIVATFDSLLTLRAVQKLAERRVRPVRDLVAQGIGNCVAALTGALATQLSPNVVLNARGAGRTVATPLLGSVLLLALMLGLPSIIAAIPVVVLQATVVANGLSTFDRWSMGLLFNTLLNRGRVARRHGWHDLVVVLVVMGITASGAIVAGVLCGVALACVIFIANMSRPIFRRAYRGDEVPSKRMRSAEDSAALLACGRRRAILELQGVLFFGNADDLAERIAALFDETDAIALDLHGISDIDISGAQVLHEIVAIARRRGKWLVFCNVPSDLGHTFMELAPPGAPGAIILHDLDSAIEWMEDCALEHAAAERADSGAVPLDRLDFTRGLDARELALLKTHLVPRHFAQGASICREGEAADRFWLLTKGSVSVRKALPGRPDVRVGSLAMGTVVGEMALLGDGHRSASVEADGEVECFELGESAFRALLDEHPRIAVKILANLAREMARRVRITSDYLRRALG